MTYKITIKGRLDGLNDYTKANRTNQYKGAKAKAENERICMAYIPRGLKGKKINFPVHISFRWYEKNLRRDPDNIAFAKKFILDSLVTAGVFPDDGQKYISGFDDKFYIDPKEPRIEILIQET
nr:MAG TPA: Endodeoxyribonuclease RusA [Caudoviricetes sp.]